LQSFLFKISTSDGYYLNNNNEWTTTNYKRSFAFGEYKTSELFLNYELVLPPLIADCDVTITIYGPKPLIYTPPLIQKVGISNFTYVQLLNNEIAKSGIKGEFHTVTRSQPPSSITKENQKVFNGDGISSLIGSIYKEDLIELTTDWTRKDKFENLPLLGISAMDDLRIQSNPIKVFSGNIFGQIPYMSVITIDNISGLFMPIEYDYDYKTNKSQVKLLEFYNTDIADIQYTISPDYGNNTIKPTIKG